MKKIRLGDVVSFSKGQQINGDELMKKGRYDYLNGGINPSGRWNDFNVTGDTVTVSEGGNSCGYVNYMSYPFWCGAHCYYLYDSKLNNKYLYYALKSQQEKIMKLRTGACMPNIKKNDLGKFELYITTDINAQELTVFILDKITDLIDKRKKQLEKLDELVKSRFIEMFGDCDLTAQKKEWKAVREVGMVVGGSTPKTSVAGYWNGEYRWLSPAELEQDSGVIFDSVKKITKAGIESCSLHELPVGTVILSSRAPIGKLAIAGNTFYCNQGFKNIVCSERIVPRYLYSLLLFNTEYLNSLGRGATFKEISKSIVENIKIPIPPIDLQNEFAKFVAKNDKSKFEIKQNLEKLELLKKALMQKYFG